MEQTLHGKAAVLLSENRNGGQVKRTSCNLLDGRVFTIFVSNLREIVPWFYLRTVDRSRMYHRLLSEKKGIWLMHQNLYLFFINKKGMFIICVPYNLTFYNGESTEHNEPR